MADGLAADAAANPMIRYILRNRARYEVANNSYARGMIDTIATDLIGPGPRLQMETGDDEADAWLEFEFSRWSREVKLAEKLRTQAKAKTQDGEAFTLQITNPGLPTPVKLDLRPIEADQVRFVDISLLTVPSVDGIRFDDYGNPVSYHVLRVHPGFWSYATGYIGFPWEYDVWPARYVMHWFRADRPGMHRGIPEIMPALPLYAQLRRYTLAVLQAAETAADFAMWMKTPVSAELANSDDAPLSAPNPFDMFPLQRNIVTTLPDGYDIGQTKAEQPVTTHEMFVRTILREIARCTGMPYNVVSGDFSQGSYSESNLGTQGYFREIEQSRKDLEYGTLDRVLAVWLNEAAYVRLGHGDFGEPYIPANVRRALGKITANACDLPRHTWNWVGHQWANPDQQASADKTNLQMGADSLARIWGRKGQDARKHIAANAKLLNLTPEQYIEKVLLPNLIAHPQPPAPTGDPVPVAEETPVGVKKA
jgi:capsid protein